jgi:uncharacterized PurR-regulated membrane protein YhhQ (DUF165 family)
MTLVVGGTIVLSKNLYSPFFDTGIIVLIGFYAILPNEMLFEFFIIAYLIKVGVALMDTPFCYLARRIGKPNKI